MAVQELISMTDLLGDYFHKAIPLVASPFWRHHGIPADEIVRMASIQEYAVESPLMGVTSQRPLAKSLLWMGIVPRLLLLSKEFAKQNILPVQLCNVILPRSEEMFHRTASTTMHTTMTGGHMSSSLCQCMCFKHTILLSSCQNIILMFNESHHIFKLSRRQVP